MVVKQYNVKVFEIDVENEEEFLNFAQKNIVILRRQLLFLKGFVTPKIEDFLKKEGISFTKELPVKSPKGEVFQFAKQSGLKILDKIVRSGQEIVEKSDLLVLKRVNSGAHIYTKGNFISLSLVEGKIECNGEFMLLKSSPKSCIIFNGVDISEDVNDEYFYKIKLENNEIIITKYAKEIEWV